MFGYRVDEVSSFFERLSKTLHKALEKITYDMKKITYDMKKKPIRDAKRNPYDMKKKQI
jgi:hypothetical protein